MRIQFLRLLAKDNRVVSNSSNTVSAKRYCQMLWMNCPWRDGAAEESVSGRPWLISMRLFELQFTVGEGVAIDEMGDELIAVETTPVPFGLGCQFEDHGQSRDACATGFGLARAMAHRGEGRFAPWCPCPSRSTTSDNNSDRTAVSCRRSRR